MDSLPDFNDTAFEKRPVWLITGCSTGFGREIASVALKAGLRVVVTARNCESVADLEQAYPDTALPLALDICNAEQRAAVLSETLGRFGRLDVLVNNAGYGYVAAIEEGEDEALRAMFETNFFATLALSQLVLPVFRAQKSGRILNNSSQAGLMANPGTGFYSASKYALEGLMEALTREVAPLGIQVVSVQPGAFRTDWAGRSMQRGPGNIEDYRSIVGERLDMIAQIDGQQPGDPELAAEVFLKLGCMDKPPETLVLGGGLLQSYRDKLVQQSRHLEDWAEVSSSVDYSL